MEGRGGSFEDPEAPESWEAADVEESMKRLLLSSSTTSTLPVSAAKGNSATAAELDFDAPPSGSADFASSSAGGVSDKPRGLSEDAINQVDQFLREALQKPRERLSVLRMEQDIQKFIRDPTQEQMEFKDLPTSYLRLAAHRVAQHYFLPSMVLVENTLPEGLGTIVVRKSSSECRLPHVRLADIPANLPQEESGVIKLAIKQRPQKHCNEGGGNGSSSLKANQSKTVEEREEEYNRARARIFNSGINSGSSCTNPENETKVSHTQNHASLGIPRFEEKSVPRGADLSASRGVNESSAGSSRSARNRSEKESAARYRPNNRVAIFRDRDVERKDPDYDRSYDRYMQRFDPGFGFNTGQYTVQPMYAPAVNYNTEFPQLAPGPRPQVSVEHQPPPVPQHLTGHWVPPSNAGGIGYGHPDTMMAAYAPANHVCARSASAMYMQPPQYPSQHPGMPFIHPHEHIQQAYTQSLQQQHDAALALARPR